MKSLVSVAAVITIGAPSIFGQTPDVEAPACNAQFAQLLVQQQVTESRAITEPVKRIKILIRSANFLWEMEQPTARSYFIEAWRLANDRFNEKGFESSRSGDKSATIIQLLPDQRMEVVRAILKHDKDWGGKLIEQMLATLDKTRNERSGFDRDRELFDLMNVAVQSARTDPELSLLLMRRIMKYPLTSHWFFGLYGLAQNKALADKVYSEALLAYRGETPHRLLYLSAYPFGNTRIFGIERYNMAASSGIEPNELLARSFLETFFARIGSYASNAVEMNRPPEEHYFPEPVYIVSAINDLEPYIVEQFPDLLDRFGLARAQAASLLSSDSRKSMDDREKEQRSMGLSFEERIKQLEQAEGNGKLTDLMIVSLLTQGSFTDDQFEALWSWLNKIKEDRPRGQSVNYYWFKRAKLAIEQKRLEDAEKHAAKVPEIEHRAVLFFDLVRVLEKNLSNSAALFDILNRVSKLARGSENSVAKAQVLLGLSNMYEKVNHALAIDELSEAIRVTNQLKDPDIFQTGISRQIVGKGFSHSASFSVPGFDLEGTFDELSKKDFEMSLAQANALNDRYFRTLAVIAVARNCAKNAKKIQVRMPDTK